METHPLDLRTGHFPWQIVLLFLGAAAISRAPAVIVLAVGALITWLVVEITGRLALAAVDARVTLTPDRIIAGELPIAIVEIVNRKPLPLPWLDARLFLAETASRRALVPDPLRFRGVRPHRHGDPRKEIHWKASARLRELQTKLYEPATSLDSIFLVNVASYDQYWIQADPEAAELVVSAAAELVRLAAAAGRQVGLVTNGIDNLTHERPRSALGRGPRSLTRSLEILARLGPYAVGAPETVFLRERGRLPWGATIIIVTPRLGPGLANAAVALRRAHHRFVIVAEVYLWRVVSLARGAVRWSDARNAVPFGALALAVVSVGPGRVDSTPLVPLALIFVAASAVALSVARSAEELSLTTGTSGPA